VDLSFFKSLRFRVAAAFLLVSTIPLGIVGVFSVRTADRLIVGTVTNQLENLAADKAELLRRWMAERKADVAVVAGSSIVRGFDPQQIASYLRLVQSQYRVYNRVVVVGPQKRTLYDTAGSSDQPADDETCSQQAVAQGIYLSPVSWDEARKEAVFRIAEAIRGSDEAPVGVVCATVSTQAILAQVLRISLGETGECYLVDSTGTFLAHKEPRRILKENIAQSESFTNLFGGERSGPIYTDYRGIPVLGASRPVADTPWYIVVEQDRDEAFAGSYQIARNIQIAIATTVICAIGLSWVLATSVTSPIRTLSEAAESLSRGDFQRAMETAPLRRADEIGTLDAAFHRMASQLWDRHTRLQQQIGTTEDELRKSEDRLKQTVQAAARSEQLAALGRLAAGVAHEIRTPLTSLKLFLQSLREDVELPPDQVEDLAIALRQGQRMEATINQFLDFARPRDPCPTDVDFAKLVDDALLVVQPRANHQEVEITESVAADLPHVKGDGRQLGEALVNLLVNALEVMPDGGRLTIAVGPDGVQSSGAGQGVRIDVTDTGPGVQPADLHRLFEPFFTTKASGSGLGLAIVRQTVQRHGGTVSVRSKPGAGTTFSMSLPAGDL
jgi:signal transduction histidine kinase